MTLMGGRLGRYIFRQAAGATALILLSLTGIVWIGMALRQLNLMTTQGQGAWTFLAMTLLAIPNLMGVVAPLALLVATIHTLNRLSGDSELIILTAAGGTIWDIARPLLLLALLVSTSVGLISHFAMPWSLKQLRDYIIQVRTDLISQVIQPGKFSSLDSRITFHIRDRGHDGELKGILMHDSREAGKVSSYLAESGFIVKQGQSSYLDMHRGHVLTVEKKDEPARIIAFDNYPIDLDRFERKGEVFELKPRERYFGELVRPAADDKLAKTQPGLLRAELHERFAGMIYPFTFVMIAVALIGQARTTRQNRMEAIVLAFVISACGRLGGLAATNLVSLRASALWLLYGLPIAGLLLALAAAHLGMRPRRQSRVTGGVQSVIEAVWTRIAALLPRRRRVAAGG